MMCVHGKEELIGFPNKHDLKSNLNKHSVKGNQIKLLVVSMTLRESS